jgi:hypothetical protein
VPGTDTTSLFDYLVGAQQEGLRNLQAERLGGGEIDDQLEFGVKTIGMLRVSWRSGCNTSAVLTRITSGFNPTSSIA